MKGRARYSAGTAEVTKQHQKFTDMCRTRRVENREALESMSALFLTVSDCLDQMVEDADQWDCDSPAKTLSFLSAVTSSTFLVALIVSRIDMY